MPVPASITELSTTAASNSPARTESPITADDYLRTYAAFIAKLRDDSATRQELAAENGGVSRQAQTAAYIRTMPGRHDGDQTILKALDASAPLIGGGTLIWDAASTEVDNGGTVFAVTGVDTGRWKREVTNGIYAAWFGVHAGATPEQNQVGLQAAIDLAIASNCIVRLPFGQITSAGSVTIPQRSGTTLIQGFALEGLAAGRASTFLVFNTGGLIVKTTGYSIRNLTVKSVDGNGIHAVSGVFNGENRTANRGEFVNVRVEGCGGNGLLLEGVWNIVLNNCYSRFNAQWGVHAKRDVIYDFGVNALTVIGGEYQGNGGVAADPVGAGTFGGWRLERSFNVNFFGVTVEGNNGDGFVIGNACSTVLISGCYMELNGTGAENVDIRTDIPAAANDRIQNLTIISSLHTATGHGGGQKRAMDFNSVRGLRVINPQFNTGQSLGNVFQERPIRVSEYTGGMASGWVEGPTQAFGLGTTDLLENNCTAFGQRVTLHIGAPTTMPAAGTTRVPAVVERSASDGTQVEIIARFQVIGAAGSGNLKTEFRANTLDGANLFTNGQTLAGPASFDGLTAHAYVGNASKVSAPNQLLIYTYRFGDDAADTYTSPVTFVGATVTLYRGWVR